MKVVMVASEAKPFIKTGGLADVVYSLSKELVVLGHEVSVIIPFYDAIRQKRNFSCKKLFSFPINMSWRNNEGSVYVAYNNGITFYLIDSAQYFLRDHIYGDDDDNERFAFFTLASKELLYRLNSKPDVIHLHDWHVGVFPCLIKEDDYAREYFKNTKLVFTIHNPAFQGTMDKSCVTDYFNLPEALFYSGKIEYNGAFSAIKTAIIYSDVITTVSPTHREELLSNEGSYGLNHALKLREFEFYGILNGIDYLEFNPKEDDLIYQTYSPENVAEGKKENKKQLLEQLHIKSFNKPLYSIVSRLTWQKGVDLVIDAAYNLASQGANVVILGSGERRYEDRFEELRDRYQENVALYIGYNDELAHKIYAASDFFLMPSLFEPCGLGQMIAQRYGTLPMVRTTGGLRDSVFGYNGKNIKLANGFTFDDYDGAAFVRVSNTTMDVFNDSKIFDELRKNAMAVDNSWTKSAKNYLEIYKK